MNRSCLLKIMKFCETQRECRRNSEGGREDEKERIIFVMLMYADAFNNYTGC